MKKLLKNLGVGSALLASPIAAQQNQLEVRTRVCEFGRDSLPVAVLAEGENPLYAIVDTSLSGSKPFVIPWENPTRTRTDRLNSRGEIVSGSDTVESYTVADTTAEQIPVPCHWAGEDESLYWRRGFIPSDSVSIRGDSVYIRTGGKEFVYETPKRE